MNDNDDFENKLDEISNRILEKALSEEEENAYTETLFESIKHINEYGQEFWYARELQEALEYKEWRNFNKVIDKAKEACKGSENSILDHFVDVNKIVKAGVAQKEIEDIQLSRYACYLIPGYLVRLENKSTDIYNIGKTFKNKIYNIAGSELSNSGFKKILL